MRSPYVKLTHVVSQPCETFEWEVTDWGQCSVDCGSGVKYRDVTCRVSNGTVIKNATEADCYNAGPKPSTTEDCSTLCFLVR